MKIYIFYYFINLPCPIYAKVSLVLAFWLPYLCIINNKISFHNLNLNSIMLPWFIYLLLQFGLLSSPEQWNTLTPAQQIELEIITTDVMGG